MVAVVYSLLVVLYIISQFAFASVLNWAIGILALIALIYSSSKAKGTYLISGIIFLIIGLALFLFNRLPWYTFLLHFKPMLGLLSLFLILPFISSLLRVGHYDKNLSTLLEDKVSTLDGLYRRSFIVGFVLGLFLNIAILPLLIGSLKNRLSQLPSMVRNKFYSQNLPRAFFLTITWSPMEVMVSLSLDITKVEYFHILPIIVLMVGVSIALDWSLSALKYRKIRIAEQPDHGIEIRKIFKQTYRLGIMLFVLILLISLTKALLHKGFLLSVVLVLIPFSLVWTVMIRKPRRYWAIAVPAWKERTRGLANYFFMFLSAGFFIEMVAASGLMSVMQPLFTQVSEHALLLYMLIAGYFLGTSLIGLHPLVSITFLAGLLQPLLAVVNPVPLTVVLISCSLTPTMYSPYNVTVSILADQLKVNPYRIGLWNIPFALYYMALSITIASILGLILK